ncbi:MAG: hypothetical protein HN742_06275 [Lentisphaerae bacterium]|jgi:hypothetical protein|nr:hypothetical protein [Lentisphaerota bacterium]MBT4820182.1 hypothetical protein [Lentisphaerota bacterium]MBT5610012.1 hypothetical protein [Lentisphaerota bacterium]MBT7059135.1 hypothetical protein [Lentisphaerota bacterium]MBT7841457.1 hypothetical protein [Lentisphaerota bacterium]
MAPEPSEALAEAVLAKSVDQNGSRKLRCADALELAATHGVPPTDIGRVCNKLNIKVNGCQLGCFK